jgi:nicotinate phosphoribosyltransferase
MTSRQLELITDLYELTMAQAYHQHGVVGPATFSLFVRKLPANRAYLVAAGLEDVLQYLEGFRFSGESIDYLRSTGIFSGDFLDYLGTVRFAGDVWAVPEGRLVFANEPIIEVTAPVIEAQLVETYIINQVNLQTMLAAKASRCVAAARGRGLVDFGLRRTQGTDAGMKSARVSYMAGFQATSNVLAGKEYGIPVSGTMAHSFITAFEHETDAFRAFAESFPDRCVLLIDTYDTLDGAHKAVQVAREMESRGHRLRGVRLDSGDMLALSKEVRGILDSAGLTYVEIFASGGLDEFEIDELLSAGATIDAFGVGTKLGVSGDAPWLDAAYKMVSYEDRPVLKLSTGKPSLPGPKQVYRRYDAEGRLAQDVIAARDEPVPEAEPLLEKVMEKGRPLRASPSLEELRRRFAGEFARLPEAYKALRGAPEYPVEVSAGLQRLYETAKVQAEAISLRELGES